MCGRTNKEKKAICALGLKNEGYYKIEQAEWTKSVAVIRFVAARPLQQAKQHLDSR